MPPFDQLLDQATHRLRIDPELQREVRHELLTHLEDSAAEHRAAGVSEQEAAQQAIKDFGDPEPLSDQLFSANRRRIRFRKVAKWTMRAVLPPAAAVVAVSLAWGAVMYVAFLATLLGWNNMGYKLGPPRWAFTLVAYERNAMLSRISPSKRLIFNQQMSGEDALQNARALAQRWPDDPLYQANYVIYATSEFVNNVNFKDEKNFIPTPQQISLSQTLSIIDHAQSVEPDNGFYNLMKAAALFKVSASIREEIPEKDLPGFDDVSLQGKKVRYTFSPIKINNPSRFEQGLTEIRKAAAKPYFDSHVVNLLARRLNVLPRPNSLNERMMRLRYAIMVLLPHLNYYRWIFRVVGAHIIHLAQQGKTKAALKLVAEVRTISAHAAVRSHMAVEFLVAVGLHGLVAQQEIMVDKIAGRHNAYTQAREQYHQEQAFTHHLRRPSHDEKIKTLRLLQSAGMVNRFMVSSIARPATLRVAPERKAEYAVTDQAALAVFLVLLLIVAVGAEARALLVRNRQNSGRLFIFVGWRRLGRVVLLAGVLPVGLYGLYAWLIPGVRHFGLTITHARLITEYSFIIALVAALLRRLGDAAVCRRAAELGMHIFSPSTRWLDYSGILLILAMIAYEIVWYALAGRLPPALQMPAYWLKLNFIGYVLAALWLVYALAWLLRPVPAQTIRKGWNWEMVRSLLGRLLVAVAAILLILTIAIYAPVTQTIGNAALVTIMGIIVAAVLSLLVYWWRRRPETTAPRPAGLLPIILALALILGLGGGGFLRWREARAVAQMPSVASRMLNEVADSRYQPLKERLSRE